MSILAKATVGFLVKKLIYLIYGPEGAGKTTLASWFEKPLVIDLEDGSAFLSHITRIASGDVTSFKSFMSLLNEIHGTENFKTLVIDSLEALESLIQRSICEEAKVKSIEDIGFGKGYVMAREKMEDVMRTLQALRDKKQMNIIIVAHSAVKPFTDPNANVSYDRYVLRANDKLAAIAKDLSDVVLFMTHRVDTVKQSGKDKVKAYGDGERVLYSQYRPAHDAKSRYPLPFEIPFRLEDVKTVVDQLIPKNSVSLEEECLHLVTLVKDAKASEKASQAIKDAQGDPVKLQAIKRRLEEVAV